MPSDDAQPSGTEAEHAKLLAAAWLEAELTMRIAESIGGELIFPAMRALQSAGKTVIGVLHEMGGVDQASVKNALLEAAQSCNTARMDAYLVALATMSFRLSEVFASLSQQAFRKPESKGLDVAMRAKGLQRALGEAIKVARSRKEFSLTNVELESLRDEYISVLSAAELLGSQQRNQNRQQLFRVGLTVIAGTLVGLLVQVILGVLG